jgi:ABC-type multidrug transport system fused ATPase/permease subunit
MTAPAYDDRLDRRTRIGSAEAWRLLLRSIAYIRPIWRLYVLKFFVMAGSILPYFLAPWPLKIIVDHVLLAKPIAAAEVRYPPGIEALVLAMAGLPPLEILTFTLLAVLVVVLFLGLQGFVGGPGGHLTSTSFLAEGHDQATRAENEASAGWSNAGGLLGYLDVCLNMRLAQSMTHMFRSQLLRRLVRLPMTTLDDQRIGDSVYRAMYDTPSLSSMAFDMTMTPITHVLLFAGNLTVIYYTYGEVTPELFWVALLVLPVAFAIAWPFASMARGASQDARSSGSRTTDTIEESISNIVAVQGLGGNERERGRFDADSRESFRQYRRLVLARVGMTGATTAAGIALIIVAAIIVSNEVIAGELSAGDFTAVLGVYGLLGGALGNLATLWFQLQDNVAGARRVFFFVDMPDESQSGTATLPPIRDGIVIEGVDFAYPDGRSALRGIDLEARLGEIVAIVGPTGAGKTSLAYLIPRFIAPTRGRVLVDGRDVAGLDVDSLRAQIALVFQEHVLFSGTIAENIGHGKPGATRAEIEAAARQAGAHEFISALPEAYDTEIGRAGSKLSVGQKQRLCIARGLVRGAPILILDEPTSALDPETEAALVDTIRRAGRDHLVIVIAHRLSTIRSADQVVFMDEGRIRERGSHEALMQIPGGAYRRFVELQRGDAG